ncbi:hypothetical protein HPB47_007492 [Ixodes persulcatus]|uniref:Uncharacterized protein n=1 Tax=Ixodes persulcatus TaxID=34615 RepID=A0AC60P891_IXOPE|nr:hypothetical protein HPB47_007492 [Ixodes persulcatus]
MSALIANCFRHAGFSRTRSPLETQATPEFNDCDELSEEAALGNVDDEEDDDEPPREIPTSAETWNMLRLLRNKVKCSGGEERVM